MKKLGLFALIILSIGFLQSCKNKNPSIIKIYVRNSSNELVNGAKVVIIGDVNSDPPTMSYVDTVLTNSSGFAEFNMEDYYSVAGEDNSVAYFDIVVKFDAKSATGSIRSRAHTTAVETIYLPQ